MKGPYDVTWAQWFLWGFVGIIVTMVTLVAVLWWIDMRENAERKRKLMEAGKLCKCGDILCRKYGCPQSHHWTGDTR